VGALTPTAFFISAQRWPWKHLPHGLFDVLRIPPRHTMSDTQYETRNTEKDNV
jgi:hypothetical protein